MRHEESASVEHGRPSGTAGYRIDGTTLVVYGPGHCEARPSYAKYGSRDGKPWTDRKARNLLKRVAASDALKARVRAAAMEGVRDGILHWFLWVVSEAGVCGRGRVKMLALSGRCDPRDYARVTRNAEAVDGVAYAYCNLD